MSDEETDKLCSLGHTELSEGASTASQAGSAWPGNDSIAAGLSLIFTYFLVTGLHFVKDLHLSPWGILAATVFTFSCIISASFCLNF